MNESRPGVLTGVAGATPVTGVPDGTAEVIAEIAPPRWRISEFRWYLIGFGAYFLGLGINQVLIQYIIVVELHESAERFSLAQTAMMIPMLIAVLLGGAAADRSELRRHLIRMQFLLALPPIALALTVGFGYLTFGAMIAYGVTLGIIQSFVQPARDSFLTNVAERSRNMDIPRAVAAASAVQFIGQLGGFALVGAAERIGSMTLLVIFSIALVFAALCTMRTSPTNLSTAPARPHEPMLTLLSGGFRQVWRSETLRTIITCMFAMGIFGASAMMVMMPIILRDVYHGGSLTFAFFNVCFVLGTATSALVLSYYRRTIRRQGRAMLLSMSGGIISMVVIHFAPPLWVVFPMIFYWGLCGGVWMSMSRAVVQENAANTHRARILSVMTLGMLGGAPIGAILAGQLIPWLGVQNAILVPPVGMVTVLLFMILFTKMWHFERPRPTET